MERFVEQSRVFENDLIGTGVSFTAFYVNTFMYSNTLPTLECPSVDKVDFVRNGVAYISVPCLYCILQCII